MVQGIVFNGIMKVNKNIHLWRKIMFLGMDGKYSAFEELMHYYHFSFSTYYSLFFIVLVNCIKAIINFISIKKGKTLNKTAGSIDLFVSILAGMGLGYGLIFQGILSDVSTKYFEVWGYKMIVLCVVCFILFIIQLIFTLKIRGIRDKYLYR